MTPLKLFLVAAAWFAVATAWSGLAIMLAGSVADLNFPASLSL